MVTHEKHVEIRWPDMDAFDHVNHAVYLSYFEACRDAWLERIVAGASMQFVVRRVEVDYLAPLHQRDGHAVVTVSLDRLGRSSVVTREELRATSDGRVCARAACVLVHVGDARDAAQALPAELVSLFERAA